MKQTEFFGKDLPEGNPVFSPPLNEWEVKYLTVRNASWGLMDVIQSQQAKQIAEVLVPFAYACHHHSGFDYKETFQYPDLRTDDGVRSFFDDELCKKIAEFVRKEVK